MAAQLARHTPGRKLFSSRFASIVVTIITILWVIPTLGLFISSFRTGEDIYATGWWHVFVEPKFTLQNYREVLFGGASESLSDASCRTSSTQ